MINHGFERFCFPLFLLLRKEKKKPLHTQKKKKEKKGTKTNFRFEFDFSSESPFALLFTFELALEFAFPPVNLDELGPPLPPLVSLPFDPLSFPVGVLVFGLGPELGLGLWFTFEFECVLLGPEFELTLWLEELGGTFEANLGSRFDFLRFEEFGAELELEEFGTEDEVFEESGEEELWFDWET